MIVRRWLSIVVASVLCVGCMSFPVMAQQHQLRQVIECRSAECQPRPPIVHPVRWTGDERVITGEYSPFANHLRVTVAGVTYELGRHPELTAVNGAWRLDLSQRRPPLAAGTYDVIVMVHFGDRMLQDTTHDELTVVAQRGLTAALASTGQPLYFAGGAAVLLLAAGVVLLYRKRRRRPPG